MSRWKRRDADTPEDETKPADVETESTLEDQVAAQPATQPSTVAPPVVGPPVDNPEEVEQKRGEATDARIEDLRARQPLNVPREELADRTDRPLCPHCGHGAFRHLPGVNNAECARCGKAFRVHYNEENVVTASDVVGR